ncbi:hypothetical protein [Fictibacillus barbaricus]|nr:hypothetical protein [Fictibacillus barbaricus]
MKILVASVVSLTMLFFPLTTQAIHNKETKQSHDKIFLSKHIDDAGVRMAIHQGLDQPVDRTFYDNKNDIKVHFESLLTDDKETKLLLTFQSKKTNLKNYYVDNFEGDTKINLFVGNEQKKFLRCVGWGSRYYDSKENKVAKALSFESLKKYAGQEIRLEIENLTVYDNNKARKVKTIWPLDLKLDKSAMLKREFREINKEFNFEKETYKIKKVEFSPLETRVVVTGSDTKLHMDENGSKYRVMSKLEHKWLNSREVNKKYGYFVDNKKSGVFLKSAGEKVDPIFNKGEVEDTDDEYIMIFAPVKDRQDCILEVGYDIKIPLIN